MDFGCKMYWSMPTTWFSTRFLNSVKLQIDKRQVTWCFRLHWYSLKFLKWVSWACLELLDSHGFAHTFLNTCLAYFNFSIVEEWDICDWHIVGLNLLTNMIDTIKVLVNNSDLGWDSVSMNAISNWINFCWMNLFDCLIDGTVSLAWICAQKKFYF